MSEKNNLPTLDMTSYKLQPTATKIAQFETVLWMIKQAEPKKVVRKYFFSFLSVAIKDQKHHLNSMYNPPEASP